MNENKNELTPTDTSECTIDDAEQMFNITDYDIIPNKSSDEAAIIEDPKKSRDQYVKIALPKFKSVLKIAVTDKGTKLRIATNESVIHMPQQPGFTLLNDYLEQTIPKNITYESYIHKMSSWLDEFGKAKAIELTNKDWVEGLTIDESKKTIESIVNDTIVETDQVIKYLRQYKALLEIFKKQK